MFTFRKNERLCSKKLIEDLYQTGKRFTIFPITVHWKLIEPTSIEMPAQVLIIAPKRRLRHAVDRNRTKRLMRESYRIQKQRLYNMLDTRNKKMVISLSYIHHEIFEYQSIQKKVEKVIDKLIDQIGETV